MKFISIVGTMRIEFDGTATVGDPHAIVSVTDNGSGSALAATQAPHGLNLGDIVAFAGTTIYDGVWKVASVVNTTAFLLGDQAGAPVAFGEPATGGSWRLATDLAFTAVADAGGGSSLFTVASSAGLTANAVIMITGSSSYNGVGVVAAVADGTHFSSNSFAFAGTDTGIVHF